MCFESWNGLEMLSKSAQNSSGAHAAPWSADTEGIFRVKLTTHLYLMQKSRVLEAKLATLNEVVLI